MADDPLSGWTFQELTPPSGSATTTQPQEPQIGKHSPEDYATLAAQQAIQRTHDMGLMPDVGMAQGVFTTAMNRALDLQKTQQEQLQRVLPNIQTATGPTSQLTVEEQQKAAVALQKEQLEKSPGAVATAAANVKAGRPGMVVDLPQTDQDKLDMLTHGYDAVNDLSGSFNYMMSGKPQVDKDGHPVNPPWGTGGQFKSVGGHLVWFADAHSASALNFDRQREMSFIPISRAVLGETGATPTKEAMVEQSLKLGLPRIQDDEETGNAQIFNYKKSIMEQLYNMYKNRVGNVDTSKIADAIARYGVDFNSPTTQAWNPTNVSHSVVLGNSPVAKDTIDNVNKGALAGMGNNAQPAVTPQPTPAVGMFGQ